MLFFLYFSFSISIRKASIRSNKHFYTCNHDHEFLTALRKNPPHKLTKDFNEDSDADKDPKKIANEVDGRNPISVKICLDAIKNPSIDSKSCNGPSPNNITPQCRNEDKLSEQSKNVIIQTMENVEKYIHQLVNVTSLKNPIEISDSTTTEVGWEGHEIEPEFLKKDLFIYVLTRPYGPDSQTLASARAVQYNTEELDGSPLSNQRPTVGLININVAKLPTSAQDYNSGDRQFFITCMHELMHVLAFAGGLFPKWLNRTSGNKYDVSRFNFQFKNNYDVTQSFINSPKLTSWINERFQVINPELVNFGLELEDGGGSGTAGSHPNSRLYFTDIMQGKTYGPGYFSPIFFHSLYDSGWYEPNYEMMEDLPYLNPRYIGEPISQYVLTEPPRESFPKELFCSNNYQAYCYYDYSYKAVCDTMSHKDVMESENKDFIKYKNNKNFTTWYGGPNNYYSDEENFDFMPVLFPSGDSNCRNPNAPAESEDVANMAKRMEETYSLSSVCVLTTIWKQSLTQFSLQKNAGCYKARCGEDNKLRITLPNTPEQVCIRENQRIYKKGSTKYALCPNVEAACSNMPNKSTMVTIESAIPDRGPYNGHNFVLLQGFNLEKYSVKKITFGIINDKQARVVTEKDYSAVVSFEKEKGDFIEYTNERILIKMPDNLKLDKKFIGVPIDLIFDTEDTIDVNFVEKIYTFLKRDYSNPE